MKLNSAPELVRLRESLASHDGKPELVLSADATCCVLRGAKGVAEALKKELKKAGLADAVHLRLAGCLGFCEIEPMLILSAGSGRLTQDLLYQRLTSEDVPEIVSETLGKGVVLEKLLYTDPATGEKKHTRDEVPFYKKQNRLLLSANELLQPISIEDYIATGGYSGLAKALTMKPEAIIEAIKLSGLRGRGGGGFPTGHKWESAREAPSEDGIRYVICNGEEGDPGSYKDRSVLEANPHAIIEGMIIGSWAIGSHDGHVYVRPEYPLAVEHLSHALKQAEELGFLGDDILSSGHSFHITLSRIVGAYVCGESTALMASLEGSVGRPRAKYVHTVERGLYERPSCLNNVETWATVPKIIANGAAWFSAIGTQGSKGTKILSLVGKVNNTGVVEVPMGTPLWDVIFDIGGGIRGGRKFKAVQTGGPSGGCIPESLLDVAVDFDELKQVGSMLGPGIIVLDEDTCMVDMAKYYLNFLRKESCGKCVACREGVRRMLQILERISAGQGYEEDLAMLAEIGEYLKDTALCGLGTSAANPILTTLKYFRDEYEAHIREHYCPAGVCKPLFRYEICAEACNGCQACAEACPVQAVSGEKGAPHVINEDACNKCGICYEACSYGAIAKARIKERVA